MASAALARAQSFGPLQAGYPLRASTERYRLSKLQDFAVNYFGAISVRTMSFDQPGSGVRYRRSPTRPAVSFRKIELHLLQPILFKRATFRLSWFMHWLILSPSFASNTPFGD